MASAFARWKGSGDQVAPIPGFLKPIDTNAIARQLKLSEKGSERGAEELPHANEDVLDGVEQTIVQKIESEWAWQGDTLLKTLRAYADRLVGYSVSAKLAELRLIAQDARARFQNASVQADAELGPLKEAFIAARDELRGFKARHKINRPARDPTGRWVTFGFLFILVAIESVLNGVFFAKGSERGLIGGVGTAIGISLVNVTFAWLLGMGPARFINYRNIIIRVIGFLTTVIGFAALVALHAFAAHYRDAMAHLPEDQAWSVALQTLLSTPWAIHSLSTAYLFGLGILFATGGFWKGYRFDDPYPFYGAAWRRSEAARVAYSEEHQLLFDDLEDFKDDAIEQIQGGIATIPLFPQRAAEIRQQRMMQVDAFRVYESSVETAANQLLQLYRDENRRHRKTKSPSHFSERWELPHRFLDSGQVRELTVEPKVTEPDIPSVIEELQHEYDALLKEYAELIQRNPHPMSMS
jgi:hypothetical protein